MTWISTTSIPLMMPNAIMNNGEACISLTRILAPRDRYAEVTEALVEQVRALKVGDALDPATEVGPLVAERQRERVENYIRIGQDEGAKVAVGGGRPEALDTGWFVEPTVFVDVDNSMRIAQEEIFGPVLSVIPYDDDADAVRIANDSDYGLCGAVFTGDNDRGLDVARQVRTGTYMVNSNVPIDFSSPFGGFKASGRRAASSARTASSCSWRRRPSTSRPGTARRSDRGRPSRPVRSARGPGRGRADADGPGRARGNGLICENSGNDSLHEQGRTTPVQPEDLTR